MMWLFCRRRFCGGTAYRLDNTRFRWHVVLDACQQAEKRSGELNELVGTRKRLLPVTCLFRRG